MNGLWGSPPDRDLPPGRLAERREHLVSEIRQTERRTAPTPGHSGRRGLRPRIAAALGALAVAAFAVVGGAIWLSGESADDADGVAGATSSTTQASTTSVRGREATGINAVLAVHSVRAVTGETTAPISSEDGESFPYLVLEVPGSEMDGARLFQAYEVLDSSTGEVVGIQTVYHRWWTTSGGEIALSEVLLRVQDVGQDYEWLSYLTELAESSELVRIGEREVTVYRIPDENIEEGSYDLDVLYWVEESGVEGILIPWGLSGEEATGLITGLRKLSWEEWKEWLAIAPGPGVPATTTTVVEGG
jgi:hypothetical protein